MLVVFTGNGKGKTTASLGAALRAVGRGQRVLMVQFIKGPWKSGEDYVEILMNEEWRMKNDGTKKQGSFELKKMGLGFVGILGDKLPFEEHQKAAKEALEFISLEIKNWKLKIQDSYDMVIMDEVNVAVSLKLVEAKAVLDILNGLAPEKIVLLTGRGAPQEFIDAADLATEMREIKHPYAKGELAKINIEF